MTSVCDRCGFPARGQAAFCSRCGHPLGQRDQDDGRLRPGTPLSKGDYRILRSISKGGMGHVYLASDRRAFDRYCVVKEMLDYYDTSNPEERQRAQQRFEDEGRILATLSHPGIPKILAFFAENGRFYIVMEYIHGQDLRAYITHEDHAGRIVPAQRMPREELLRHAVRVCQILEYLHGLPKPVVHQDVKPANLILEQHVGQVRLVDFGTARARIPQGEGPGSGKRASVYGTDGYAPPEQYRGKPVPRSDVFSLGATLYHLLSDDDPREHPFTWPKLDEIPSELRSAMVKALRNDPEARSTAQELRQALETLVTPERTLETFTFPGGVPIRSVGALPALSDENWDAARSFLYNGDYARWLRDINRLDLVLLAEEISKKETNHDTGLELFLRAVDPGLPHPKPTPDPEVIDLGRIARHASIDRTLTIKNATRGYSRAAITPSQPWVEVEPGVVHLWTHRPAEVRVRVHASDLPFRKQQHAHLTITSNGRQPVEVPVTASVSLFAEAWRILRRTLGAMIPESWRWAAAGWKLLAQAVGAVRKPFLKRRWLTWILWALVGAGIGVGLHYLPGWAQGLNLLGYRLARLDQIPADIPRYFLPVILGPPLLYLALLSLGLVILVFGGLLLGAIRGMIRSFTT